MNPDPARGRFIAIQFIRATGVALAVFGLFIIARKADLPIEAGYGLFLVGLFEALIAPIFLTRRWKSPGE